MGNIILIVICLIQFIVIAFFICVSISSNKEIKEQSEIIEIRDRKIRFNIDMYNLALERALMLINELKERYKEK